MVAHTGFLTSARRLAGRARVLVALDEDALAGALLGGLDDGVFELGGHHGDALGAAGLVL